MLLLSAGVLCSPGTVALAIEGKDDPLAAFRKGLRSYQAHFQQTVYNDQGLVHERSSGKLYLQLPNRFNWVWERPYRQRIVSDGRSIWWHDHELRQVVIRDAREALRDTPLVTLLGHGTDRFYSVVRLGRVDGHEWIELKKTKGDESVYQNIRIGFDEVAGTYALLILVLTDGLGFINRMDLSHRQRNIRLDPALFDFVMPDGVDVIDERVSTRQ